MHDRRVLRSHLPDLTPLRENAAYRRLYAGFTLSNVGSQMAIVAIGLQVYDITGSTAAVGLVGLFALVPLVVMGLYGGSLSDHHDRRTVALVANLVAWATSIACAVQAWLGNENVWVLYVLVAVWNGAFGVSSPARTSIYPRILPREQLPAANALGVIVDVGGDDGRPAPRRPARRLGGVRGGVHGRRARDDGRAVGAVAPAGAAARAARGGRGDPGRAWAR